MLMATPETEDFESRLAEFDRVGFGLTMRKIEVLLLRDNPEKAVQCLWNFIAHKRLAMASMASHPAEVLPLKIANRLDDYGLQTLYAVAQCSDEEIAEVPEIGTHSVAKIRSVIDRVSRGVFRITPHAPELEPEWEVDIGVFKQEPEVTKISIKDALSVILADREAGISELDAEIAEAESHVAELREMRAMLTSTTPEKRVLGQTKPSEETMELEQKIFEYIKINGPMTAKDTAAALQRHYVSIGNAVKFSARLRKRGKYVEFQ